MSPKTQELIDIFGKTKKIVDEAIARYKDASTVVSNLDESISQASEELVTLDADWKAEIRNAKGKQTEQAERLALQAGMTRRNLEGLKVMKDEAMLDRLRCTVDLGSLAGRYAFDKNNLESAIFNEVLPVLLKELDAPLARIAALCALVAPAVSRDVKNRIVERFSACDKDVTDLRTQAKEADDAAPLSLINKIPGGVPSALSVAQSRMPSPGQWAKAQRDPAYMQSLVDGTEPCKGGWHG
ncbi:TPA: hypothetical protein PRT27_002930 [Escherichia coli]|nr:hypothetical protein [Escherichia coli]